MRCRQDLEVRQLGVEEFTQLPLPDRMQMQVEFVDEKYAGASSGFL